MNQRMTELVTDAERMQRRIREAIDKLAHRHWLTFHGDQAIELMRRCLHARKKPILIVHCERKPGWGQHDYEYFIPTSISWANQERTAAISGTIGPNGERCTLYWSPDKAWDESGTYVSYVSTLPEFFPRGALDAVRLSQITMDGGFSSGGADTVRHGKGKRGRKGKH